MFTGIIEEVGTVRAVRMSGSYASLDMEATLVTEDLREGDSIAVNGVCLTAAALFHGGFTADVMPETMRRSNLGSLRAGSRVNLERAMAAGGRFGGHIVSGHVDGTGRILSLTNEGNAVLLKLSASEGIIRHVVEKGSVALDGISLTVAAVSSSSFTVSLIPHTLKSTSLSSRRAGDVLNIENDIIGKYVERFVTAGSNGSGNGGLDLEFLMKNGF